jgi:hypothetical protein
VYLRPVVASSVLLALTINELSVLAVLSGEPQLVVALPAWFSSWILAWIAFTMVTLVGFALIPGPRDGP